MEPGDRRLARPPSERWRTPEAAAEEPRPDLARAVAIGAGAALLFALGWLLLAGVLAMDYGIVVAAAAGGWLVGSAVAFGAWASRPHRPRRSLQALAVALTFGGWLVGNVFDWLWSQALLPGSSLSLPERLAQTPFADWLSGQLSPLTALQVGLAVVVSWRSAR